MPGPPAARGRGGDEHQAQADAQLFPDQAAQRRHAQGAQAHHEHGQGGQQAGDGVGHAGGGLHPVQQWGNGSQDGTQVQADEDDGGDAPGAAACGVFR
ncbi:hypothetical protein G6F46_015475 [Rhizopus delemar]|nr:hypothetical protein G6F46_015475 [Rhizopus delemar]